MIAREISSLQHPIVKHLVKLRKERGYRQENKSVLIAGIKMIEEIGADQKLKTLLIEKGNRVPSLLTADDLFEVTPEILKKITGMDNPEPLAAEVALPKQADLSGKQFILALDTIADPGNLGTLLRTALGLGWEGVFITDRSVDPFNEKALRAAKGATFRIPMRVGTVEELQTLMKRMHVYIADAQGTPLNEEKAASPMLLILGNESHGSQMKGRLVSIPMGPAMESLNVAAAGAILMYELKENAQ